MKELLEAGVHIGHRVQKWNPKMQNFLYGKKQGIHIIDIIKTVQSIQQACSFLRSAGTLNKKVLFVGTKSTARDLVPLAAKECSGFYIRHRWLGGFLTNWSTMQKCIEKLCELDINLPSNQQMGLPDTNLYSFESSNDGQFLSYFQSTKTTYSGSDFSEVSDQKLSAEKIEKNQFDSEKFFYVSGKYKNLPKKELLSLKKQQTRLTKFFGGVKEMEKLPDVLVIVGQNEEKNAVKESNKLHVPNITVVDTDCNPELADYPIPANDDSFYSIQAILQKLIHAYKNF